MTKPQTTKKCAGPECFRDAKVKGLCQSHYAQLHAGKDLTVLRSRKTNSPRASKKVPLANDIASIDKRIAPLTSPTPQPKKKREPLHGMREWVCPKCLQGGRFLGSQASHRCPMNKTHLTDWVLKSEFKPAADK